MEQNQKQHELCANSQWDFSGLRAAFPNCTLKRSPELSHTEDLMPISRVIMEKLGVTMGRRGRAWPSYLDQDSGGPENDFTNRNTTFMTWNLLHLARMLKAAGRIPAHGNRRSEWEAGCRFDYPNPDYRWAVIT